MKEPGEKPGDQTLTAPMLNVLLALGREALHGYGIMQALESKTGGAEVLLPGSLYATLGRMLDAGLIEELPEAPDPDADRRRRYYRVTAMGFDQLEAEVARMSRLVRLARAELSRESA